MTSTTPLPPRFPLLLAFRGKYGRLLAALLALLASSPLIARGRGWNAMLTSVFGAVLLASVYATSPRRRTLVIGVALALSQLATDDLVNFGGMLSLIPLHYLVALVILLYAAMTLLRSVLEDEVVTMKTLQAALCVYLLMGIAWTYVYALIDLASPGSIHFSHIPPDSSNLAMILRDRHQQLIYFSYSTLTTLGYGDVVPLQGFAQVAACFEAMAGQVYMGVLIGRLVGLYVSQVPPKS